MPILTPTLTIATLAWGAFAFGAVYPWAYTPLFIAAALIGLLNLLFPATRIRRRVPWPLIIALGLVAAAILAQLVPLPTTVLATISPAADRFLREFDVVYRLAVSGGSHSHPLSIDPPRTRLALVALISLTLLLVGTLRGLGHRTLRRTAAGIVLLGAVLALLGIVQSGLAVTNPDSSSKIYGFWEPTAKNVTPFGPFVNRNHFAGWMLLALPVSLGYLSALVERGARGISPGWRARLLWLSSGRASRVLLTGAAVLTMGIALVSTVSRSGIACFAAALAVALGFVLRQRSARRHRRLLVVFLLVFGALSLGWAGLDSVVIRFSYTAEGIDARRITWADGWRIARDFPWTGTGLNTYGTATLLYQTEGLFHFAEAHNDYLQVLAEGGLLVALPAAGALLVLVTLICRRFRARADDPTAAWIRLGATTGLLAIALQSVVEFSLQMPGVAALFAVVAAMAAHDPAAVTAPAPRS